VLLEHQLVAIFQLVTIAASICYSSGVATDRRLFWLLRRYLALPLPWCSRYRQVVSSLIRLRYLCRQLNTHTHTGVEGRSLNSQECS